MRIIFTVNTALSAAKGCLVAPRAANIIGGIA
jgi:hypothetical protein